MKEQNKEVLLLLGNKETGKSFFASEYAKKIGDNVCYADDIKNGCSDADVLLLEIFDTNTVKDIITIIDEYNVENVIIECHISAKQFTTAENACLDELLSRVTCVVEFKPKKGETIQYSVKTVDKFMGN